MLFKLLALLGFAGVASSCETVRVAPAEYGTPYAEYTVKGRVTDRNDRPLENVTVRVSSGQNGVEWWEEYADRTDASGVYLVEFGDFPAQTIVVNATDTGGVYEQQTQQVVLDADDFEGSDGWNRGHATVTVDMVLAEKDSGE